MLTRSVGFGPTPLGSGVDTNQAALGHDPGHPLGTNTSTPMPELAMDSRCPIGGMGYLVNLDDLVRQLRVVEVAL